MREQDRMMIHPLPERGGGLAGFGDTLRRLKTYDLEVDGEKVRVQSKGKDPRYTITTRR